MAIRHGEDDHRGVDVIMIKPFKFSDLPLAAEVVRASFATVAEELGLTEQNCPRHPAFITTAERLEAYLAAGALMFGLFEGERLVGYASLTKNGRRAYEIHNLAVLPAYRHKGYGKQLLDFCKAKAKELKGRKLVLGIIEENTVLKAWYAANGFAHTGTKKFDFLPFTSGYMEYTIR